ncbi:hypothetical protein CAEBREN_18402 [Caenorhabditis brenneri]|uniref:Uncharacterized protein n=1 Tax=Caenorhabditis brenneri TaxID=135651 RepID=G0PI59_CAEBE|nr:hypothetical protein CAEBREN_18402 [Caenorhabditis brenneri]
MATKNVTDDTYTVMEEYVQYILLTSYLFPPIVFILNIYHLSVLCKLRSIALFKYFLVICAMDIIYSILHFEDFVLPLIRELYFDKSRYFCSGWDSYFQTQLKLNLVALRASAESVSRVLVCGLAGNQILKVLHSTDILSSLNFSKVIFWTGVSSVAFNYATYYLSAELLKFKKSEPCIGVPKLSAVNLNDQYFVVWLDNELPALLKALSTTTALFYSLLSVFVMFYLLKSAVKAEERNDRRLCILLFLFTFINSIYGIVQFCVGYTCSFAECIQEGYDYE